MWPTLFQTTGTQKINKAARAADVSGSYGRTKTRSDPEPYSF
jgi:hypothetical protein